jgi:molybdopterin molybdotransferase
LRRRSFTTRRSSCLRRLATGLEHRNIAGNSPLPEGERDIFKILVADHVFSVIHFSVVAVYNHKHMNAPTHKQARDIRQGEIVAGKNTRLHPALIGLLAAAGLDAAAVFRSPRVAVIATGDEVVPPGNPLQRGQLYASNMVEISAWLTQFGLPYKIKLVPDRRQAIEETIKQHLPDVDVFLTSGGAWGSERDLILDVVAGLNWQGIYHRVRMGPGKPVGFGLLERKPFFCLPGGPPSNEMAFLQLALPALLKMKGDQPFPFPLTSARLAASVHGRKDWTDFIHACLETGPNQLMVHPARLKSALQSMAQKDAIIIVPEDRAEIAAGEIINIQLLSTAHVG